MTDLTNDRDRDVDHAAMKGAGDFRYMTPRLFSAYRWDPFIEYAVIDADRYGLRVIDEDYPHGVEGN